MIRTTKRVRASLSAHLNSWRQNKLGPEHPGTIVTLNSLAWILANAQDEKLRDAARAVELAQAAVAAAPKAPQFRLTLGIARYRTGAWPEAIADLEGAIQLRKPDDNDNATEAFFLAMARWQLG